MSSSESSSELASASTAADAGGGGTVSSPDTVASIASLDKAFVASVVSSTGFVSSPAAAGSRNVSSIPTSSFFCSALTDSSLVFAASSSANFANRFASFAFLFSSLAFICASMTAFALATASSNFNRAVVCAPFSKFSPFGAFLSCRTNFTPSNASSFPMTISFPSSPNIGPKSTFSSFFGGSSTYSSKNCSLSYSSHASKSESTISFPSSSNNFLFDNRLIFLAMRCSEIVRIFLFFCNVCFAYSSSFTISRICVKNCPVSVSKIRSKYISELSPAS